MGKIYIQNIRSGDFLLRCRAEATEIMGPYMMDIGERAGLSPSSAHEFALKAIDHFLPPRGAKKQPKGPDYFATWDSQTIVAYDENKKQMLGFAARADGARSSWSHFQGIDRALKLFRSGEKASLDRPRIISKIAFRPGTGSERAVFRRALRTSEQRQPVFVEAVGRDERLVRVLAQGGLSHSITVESVPLIPEFPEISAEYFYARSSAHASALLTAATPTPGSGV